MERMECVCPPSFLLLLVACVRPRVRTSFLGDMEGGVLDLRARGRRRAGKLASGASRARVLFFWVGESRGEVGGWGGVGGGVTGFTHSAFSAQGSAPHAPPAAARAQAPRPHALTHTGPPAPSAQRGPAPARPHARTRRPFFSSCFFRAADSKARLLSRSSSSSPAAPRHAAPRCPALQAPLLHDLPAAPRD